MIRSVFLFLGLCHALAANAELGYFVAPDTVVADHQEFWAGVELDGCKPRVLVNEDDDVFCDVLWTQLPEGVASDATETLLGAASVGEGTHEIRGRILKFTISDPTKPIAEQPISHSLRSLPFEPDIQLRGLPLDPLRDNEVWLESGDNATTKCIFYGGLEVATPPDKIEEGKVFCRINWENIPPGFAQMREANTNLLSGKLLNADTKQILDTHFMFTVEVVVPYEQDIESSRYSIDASVDVLDSPNLEWDQPQSNTFFLSDGDRHLTLPRPMTVNNPYNEPMLVRLIAENDAVLSEQHVDPPKNGAVSIARLPLKELLPIPKSIVLNAYITVSYIDKNAPPSRRNLRIVRVPKTPGVALSKVSRDGSTLRVDYQLNGHDSDAVYRAHLTELNDFDLAFKPGTGRPTQIAGPVPGVVGTMMMTSDDSGSISVNIEELDHSRYVVKVEQLGMDGEEVIKVGQALSSPIVVSRAAAGRVGGAITMQVAPVGSWVVVPDAAGAVWNKAGTRLSPASDPMQLKEGGEYVVKLSGSKVLPVVAYYLPEVRIIAPGIVSLNSSKAARVIVNGEQALLSDYELNWYDGGEYWGESSAFPLDYTNNGEKKIRIAVSSRDNPDSFYMKSTIKEAIIDVQQEQSEDKEE